MTADDRRPSSDGEPGAARMWEAGQQALAESWRQSQEFWNSAARSWGEAAGAVLAQLDQGRSPESAAILSELQNAAFAVGQAWIRLPLALASGAAPTELQEAIARLAAAQTRAYGLLSETLAQAGARAPDRAKRP